jgi:hypothetical protein
MSSAGRAVSRIEVEAATVEVAATLNRLRPGAAAELAHDPCGVLDGWDEVQIRYVPSVEADSRCSVAGAYIWDETPPVLAVARATSAGRRAFTALHELGHHLQQSDLDLAQALASAGEQGRLLEDAVCDAFAAGVLLPDHLVDQHIPDAGPTVYDVAQLHAASSASRAAVCVRAAQRLRSPGHVLLLDYDGSVEFAAAQGVPPVRKGSSQSSVPVIQDALTSERTTRGRTRLLYRDSIRGEELFAQVGDLDDYLVAVLTTDRPPWEDQFVLPSRDAGPVAATWVCPNAGCAEEFETFGNSCTRCKIPKCPECGTCECPPVVAQKTCTTCFQKQSAHAFDGASTVCESCS